MSENATLRERAAEEIRVLLARRKISGSELARKVGVTQPYISRRLNGEVAFDLDDLERIAAVLDVDVTDLIPRRREGRIVATGTAQETTTYRHATNGQAAQPIPTGPKGPLPPAADKPGVPAAKRRPGRVKSSLRPAYA